MKTLEEYKIKCPNQWKETGYKLLATLFFEGEKGLRSHELQSSTGLDDFEFKRGLQSLVTSTDIIFDEDSKGRIYFLHEGNRKGMKKVYDVI